MGVVGLISTQPLTGKMKVLAVLLMAGMAAGGGFGGDDWKMYKQWTTLKAHESCLGEENMRIHTVDLKTAIAKCYQKDAPELNLPPFRSPYRFINTLMTSANDMEQNQVMFLYNIMKTMKDHHSSEHMSNYFEDNNYQALPYSKNYESKSWLEKMMQKMTMKKMFEKYMNNKHDNMKHSQYKNMFDFDKSDDMMDMYKNKYDYDNYDKSDSMMDAFKSKMFEEEMKENMMMYKMQQMQRSNDDSSYNPFNKNSYRERMAALLQRHKRQAPGSKKPANVNGAVTLPESLDLGDRLADKLKEEREQMEAKVGNMTCVLREMGVLNQQNELDFNTQKRTFEKYNFPSKWLKNRLLDDMEVCNKVAQSLPNEVQEEMNFPGLVNLAQVKTFMRCCKYSKMKSCMYQDVKEKLEKNFGPMDKILEQTQLTEDQLFPLVMKLLHGEEMEYYGY